MALFQFNFHPFTVINILMLFTLFAGVHPNNLFVLLHTLFSAALAVQLKDTTSQFLVNPLIIGAGLGALQLFSAVLVYTRNLALKKLQDSITESRNLSEQVDRGIVLFDQKEIIFSNNVVLRQFDCNKRAMDDIKDLTSAMDTKSKVEFQKHLKKRVNEFEIDVTINKGNDRFFYALIGRPHFYRGKRVQLLMIEDVTRKKKSDSKISEQQQRLMSLGELAANISHEIKNPLTIIRGHAQSLEEQCEMQMDLDRDKIQKKMNKIAKQAERVARIVDGLKAMSKDHGTMPYEKVNLKDIIADAIELMESRLKFNGVTLRLPDKLSVDINCHTHQLVQVISNLLSNAMDAIKDFDRPWIMIEIFFADEQHIHLHVTDCGKGIPEDVAEKIFDKFFSTKDVQTGTGLGLHLSRKLMVQMGGDLLLEPNASNTKFVVKIPKAVKKSKAA